MRIKETIHMPSIPNPVKAVWTLLFMLQSWVSPANAQVGIGTTNPNAAAQLEVSSTTKGFLPPRMSAAQRDAIANPPAGLLIWCSNCGPGLGELQVFDGRVWTNAGGGPASNVFSCGGSVTFQYNGTTVTYGTVTGAGGACWLDRNLGATRVATSKTDADAYGDLFQWGRLDDGHQNRSSLTTTTLSTSDIPGHNRFITTVGTALNDWRIPQNSNLWQGVTGTNNPCPTGWRLPTRGEWEAEIASWNPPNSSNGAFASPLKLTVPGYRDINGNIGGAGTFGYYWSSTVPSVDFDNTVSYILHVYDNTVEDHISTSVRASGITVRCIRN